MSAQVRTTPRADAHILEIVAWWREHRPAAPFLFEDELDEAFELLAAQPEAAPAFPRPELPALRRLLMRKSAYHVYYEHFPHNDEVLVYEVWSAVRGRAPEIRP
jgi:plasmid stabilization system protein ParE